MSELHNAVTCIETIPSPGNLKKNKIKKMKERNGSEC